MVKGVQNLDEFEQIIKGPKVAVYFYATWCAPCNYISSVFEQLEAKCSDVLCIKVDIDEAQNISRKLSIRAMPIFIFYQNGKKVHEFTGTNPSTLHNGFKIVNQAPPDYVSKMERAMYHDSF